MAADITPNTWLGDGYSNDSGTHTLTLAIDEHADAIMPNLTDEEADDAVSSATGDIRKVVWEFLEAIYAKKVALEDADEDIPTKFTITRSATVNATTGEITYTYTVKCYVTPSAQDVTAEPA